VGPILRPVNLIHKNKLTSLIEVILRNNNKVRMLMMNNNKRIVSRIMKRKKMIKYIKNKTILIF